MKKTVLMSAAKKARIALAVMAVCGFTFAGAQSAFAECKVNTPVYGAIQIGTDAKAECMISIAFGLEAYGKGYESVAIGRSSKSLGDGSISFGAFSEAKVKNSVALGAYSVADEENTISVGGMNKVEIGYKPNGEPIYENKFLTRRIVNVADGTKNTDAATFGQIIKAGEYNLTLDADGSGQVTLQTNAGANGPTIKVNASALAGGGASFDGTKLNTAIQDVDVAGGYKETTANANAETKGTIAGAINSAYQAGKDYTDKQLTDKVGTVTGGTYIEAGKNVAENLGKLDTQVTANTAAIGKINTAIGDMTQLDVNGKNNLVDAVNEAYKAATSAGANVGNLGDLTTTNKDNVVGAVNEVNKKANDAQTTADKALGKADTNATHIGNLGTLDTTNKADLVGAVNEVNKKANDAQTTADKALGKANTNATNIGNLGELNTTNKGNLVGAVNEVNTKAEQNKKDIALVNGRVDELGDRVDTLGGAVSKLDSKVNKVGAGAAALAALHPMEFDSDNKLTFAAGVGSYHGASAAAIGAFYRPSEQVMFSIAGNMGNGENMVNAGVSFALDRPSKTPTTKAALVKTVVAQNEQIAALNETLAEQSREIAELKAMVQQLAAQGK